MKTRVIAFALFIILGLSGCARYRVPDDPETTIYINRDGSLTNVVVEPFSPDEYAPEDLEQMVKDMAAVYNGEHGSGSVRCLSVTAADEMVKVVLKYKSAADYAAFNHTDCFFGSVSDALSAGYAKNATLKNTHGTNTVTGEGIADMANYRMAVITEPVVVKTYESILYISANLEPIDDTTARVSSETTGDAVLIIK